MNDALAATLLQAVRVRVTRSFPDQIRAALASLTDEQIWWRPNEKTNSIGHLLLHVTGSLNHYLNKQIGGIPYERDRAAEFAEKRAIPRQELLAAFDAMVANAEKTLDALTAERLREPSPEPKMHAVIAEDLLSVLAHLSTHTGQIVWIAKMLHEGALDEVWIKSHRKHVWGQSKA